ncbi:hypothetical protein BD626DRAFT_400372 [Schizophyllum amplum]|uniref:DUF1295-domain-containing protein n=1 Tax=Schizophyllum amplum TaxID=97359 RepID=A0A550CJV2_9AGAR|nr:hypothetical protein BD626DRAFT_400372 [Auriculariopsis ampla]
MLLDPLLSYFPPEYHWPVQFCTFTTVATYIASLVTSNVSQVDRVWTFLPTIYTAYFALLPLFPNTQPFFLFPYTPKELDVPNELSPRAVLMLALVVTWMSRLSYNTWRRGLFSLKDEDYRWAVLRQKIPPWLFQVLNLTFIATIQNMLLLYIAVPTAIASVYQSRAPLTVTDYALAALTLVDLALEFTADNQQYAFHAYKHAILAADKGDTSVPAYDLAQQWPGARLNWVPADARRGFVTRGLWAYVRHPNFACEQTFWWLITLFPVLPPHTGAPPLSLKAIINAPSTWVMLSRLWPLFPGVALSLLFYSSTPFTESISVSKYPEAYAAYQARVAMFKPWDTWFKGLMLEQKGPLKRKEVERLVWGAEEKKE